MKVTLIKPKFFIKSKTIDGDFAKQYFTSVVSSKGEPVLIIKKLIYTNDSELYSQYKLLKTYKGKYLLEQVFSIKASTLNMAIDKLNEEY